ncbi:hypothetical protein M409DRAFT_71408 [Zasmidium cellare ATCC 36951]|uniref:Amidohydrolase-related domain-containing protein n=1 Tax=Zasmidium cellare ATCC 36951 TaxID=1080233 RepID=A0A6A6BVL8_ZASCE|nr:uncharacterized protein M409DRAFT_71408 [Zasmidium cellare ATCC 36951]KAF2158847.1 hypothetical protein M409DRAFT_71408 [Zasmidium cellare ATCC 36951]
MTTDLQPMIALEEHYLSANFLDSESYLRMYAPHAALNRALSQQLGDLSGGRIIDMDTNGISMQVISHAPGLHSHEQCKAANDQAYEAVKANPHRLAALAVLPVSDPRSCAKELRRCVNDLGFKGALIDNHTEQGHYFTGKDYEPMWGAFQELDVPCYIHPTWPSQAQMEVEFNDENRSSGAIFGLSTSTWGWHSDVALHIIKLFSAGVFDRFPNLKIVLGHFGEMIPFMLDRIDLFCRRWKKTGRMFKDVWSKNMWITTSGVWSIDPLAMILRNTSIDRIMFSIDYPFAPNKNGKLWMQNLIASDLVDQEGTEKIAFKNAEVLLGVKVTRI